MTEKILLILFLKLPLRKWFLLELTVVAVISKVIGCYIPAKLQGLSHKDASIVGWGMSPRGEVAMIVALIALNAGLIKQDIYVSLVLMSLLTTIITPIVLRNWVYKNAAGSS
ncbi:cation:proton antiporter [Candidatus Woesearchaeota archaeon]|nr:cation:proton antiporter [Candidatus Woesearchaeota archaeon]